MLYYSVISVGKIMMGICFKERFLFKFVKKLYIYVFDFFKYGFKCFFYFLFLGIGAVGQNVCNGIFIRICGYNFRMLFNYVLKNKIFL